MILHLFKKIYITNNNLYISFFDKQNIIQKEYTKIKNEYPNLYTLYKDWMKNFIINTNYTYTQNSIYVFNNKDLKNIINDYCNYLGLTYEDYLLLHNHGVFYSDILNYSINQTSLYKNIEQPLNKNDFIYKDKIIKKDFEYFPAEYAINCLDRQWAINKYEHLRTCEILNEIRKLQINYYNNNKKLPDILYNIQTLDPSIENKIRNDDLLKKEVLKYLSKLINTDKFYMPIKDYIQTFPNLGYEDLLSFKFNWPLAKHFLETGYRIDSNAK